MLVFSEDLKKILMAGLGAAAVTVEKSKEIVDELVKKGELTLEQGKILNEELKHAVQKQTSGSKPESADVTSIIEAISNMSPEELNEVKEKISETEAKNKTADGNGENAGI